MSSILCALLLLPPSSLAAVEVGIDVRESSAFPHYFERCVGSGHGALTLREDWRHHIAMARRDLGIERVRFHGILDDDMSVSFSPNETGFVNIDSTCDFLVGHNMSMVREPALLLPTFPRSHHPMQPIIRCSWSDTT